MLMIVLTIYGVVTIIIWITTLFAFCKEDNHHGQEVIISAGCLYGLLWPLAIVYAVFVGIVVICVTISKYFQGE